MKVLLYLQGFRVTSRLMCVQIH